MDELKEYKTGKGSVQFPINKPLPNRELQKLGSYDTKTSSWVKTPDNIKKLGELFFVIAAMTLYLCTTMVQNPIMLPEGFGVL